MLIAQAATVDELIPNNGILLLWFQFRCRIQQTQLNGIYTIEVVAEVEQLQVRAFLGVWGEVPGVLDDVVVRSSPDDLDVALNSGLDLLCCWD